MSEQSPSENENSDIGSVANLTTDQLRSRVATLFSFAISRRDIKIEEPAIEKIVNALTNSSNDDARAHTDLWTCLNILSGLIAPATAESVTAISAMMTDRIKRPDWVRRYWNDDPTRKLVLGAGLWVLITLIILVLLQIVSLSVSSSLENITKAEAAIDEGVERQEDIRQLAQASTATPAQRARLNEADRQVEEATITLEASYSTLLAVSQSRWLSWVPGMGAGVDLAMREKAGINSQGVVQVSVREAAEAFLRAVSLYILPLVYGLLGACVYILRHIIACLENWSLTEFSGLTHALRRGLGALLGASIGLIFQSEEALKAATGASLPAVAFLVGYSADFAFSLLDALIDKVKQTFLPRAS